MASPGAQLRGDGAAGGVGLSSGVPWSEKPFPLYTGGPKWGVDRVLVVCVFSNS